MAKDEDKQWRCTECGTISLEDNLLRAKNPFDEADWIVGCPNCKSVEEFEEICDEPGCTRQAGCGFRAGPEYGGYRRTCYEHCSALLYVKELKR